MEIKKKLISRNKINARKWKHQKGGYLNTLKDGDKDLPYPKWVMPVDDKGLIKKANKARDFAVDWNTKWLTNPSTVEVLSKNVNDYNNTKSKVDKVYDAMSASYDRRNAILEKLDNIKGTTFEDENKRASLEESLKEEEKLRLKLSASPDFDGESYPSLVENLKDDGTSETNQYLNTLIERMENTPAVPISGISTNGVLGYYIKDTPYVGLHSGIFNKNKTHSFSPKQVAIHEYTHASIPTAALHAIDKIRKEEFGTRKSRYRTSDPYLDLSSEIYPRLMEFRYLNDLDPSKRDYTEEDIDNLREKGVDRDLINRYGSDVVARFLNEVASNNQQENIVNMAAFGGTLSARNTDFNNGIAIIGFTRNNGNS